MPRSAGAPPPTTPAPARDDADRHDADRDDADRHDADRDDAASGRHWKTMGLVRWAAGRPFVWLDDEITAADRRWVAAHHPGPALLHRVDPLTGLAAADLATVRRWLATGPPL